MKVGRADGRGSSWGSLSSGGAEMPPSAGDTGGGPEQRRIWPGEDSGVIREQGNESRTLAQHVSFLRGKEAAEPGEASRAEIPGERDHAQAGAQRRCWLLSPPRWGLHCSDAMLTPGTHCSSGKGMRRNRLGLKTIACQQSWGKLWTKDTTRPKKPGLTF